MVLERGNAIISYRVTEGCKLSFYKDGNFVAECRGVHGKHTISRTCHPPPENILLIKKPFQGRCVPGLVAWCEDASTPACTDTRDHTHYVPTFARRRAIRDRMKLAPPGSPAQLLLGRERPQRKDVDPVEDDSEPELWQ